MTTGRAVSPTVMRYIRFALLLVVLLVSLNAMLFTWNLAMAGYYHYTDKQRAAEFMYKSFQLKPSVYPLFAESNGTELNGELVKAAIRSRDIGRLERSGLSSDDIERIKTTYKDNFYLSRIMPNAPAATGNYWEHLDAVTLELMADHTMNSHTIGIFQSIHATFDPVFVFNLMDYCVWKKNISLKEYLERHYQTAPPLPPLETARDYEQSYRQLDQILTNTYRIAPGERGDNLIPCPAFSTDIQLRQKWFLSKMPGSAPFARASFTMGLDTDTLGENRFLRIMGFSVTHVDGESQSRGGAWFISKMELQQGFYIVSFDYATRTGKEAPSFWLCKDITEVHLPPTGGKWQKVIYILDNSDNKHSPVRPLFRSWGTGTLFVDNIYMAFIRKPRFSSPVVNPLLPVDGSPQP